MEDSNASHSPVNMCQFCIYFYESKSNRKIFLGVKGNGGEEMSSLIFLLKYMSAKFSVTESESCCPLQPKLLL